MAAPPYPKLRAINFGGDSGAVAGLGAAWEVLAECDWSGAQAEEIGDVTGPRLPQRGRDAAASGDDADADAADDAAERTATAKEHALRAASAAYDMLQGPGPAGAPVRPGTYAFRPMRAPEVNTLKVSVQRRKTAMGKAAALLRRAARGVRAAAGHAKALHEDILKKQAGEGLLLTRPTEADGEPTPLVHAAAGAVKEVDTRILQASALLWSTLTRMLPAFNLPIFKLTATSLEVGLLPWVPRYWVLCGEADLADGPRQGHAVRFRVAQLPDGWVRGHFIGCVAEAVAANTPHAPLLSSSRHLADGVVHLQHLALLFYISDLAKSVNFATTSRPVGYPAAGKVVLRHPASQRVLVIIYLNGLKVTVVDPAGKRADINLGAAAVNATYMKDLAAQYLKPAGKRV